MNATIDCATAADLESMADLLHMLFTLETDFRPERDKQLRGLQLILATPALNFYEKLGFEKSAMVVRRKRL